MTRAKARTIDFETYEEFLENRYQQYITNHQLNQIIYMHGFGKLHRYRKEKLISTVTTMDLLIPLRSTLEERESVSSYASLSMEQVKEDLEILKWEECPVRSVETVKVPRQQVRSRYQQRVGDMLLPTRFARAKRMSEMEMGFGFGSIMRKPRSKRKRGNC